MNLTAAVMLVNRAVRPVRVLYDPESAKGYNPEQLFKTLDDLKEGDMVVVQTGTRHGLTVAKVVEFDFAVDFEKPGEWRWAVKFDKASFDKVLEVEKQIIGQVAKARENKARAELQAAMGLGDVNFTDMDLMAAAGKTSPAIEAAPEVPAKAPRARPTDMSDLDLPEY